MEEISVLIPAAGGSSRLGRPKQLVTLDGKPLIGIAIETCLEAGFSDLNLVLGHEHRRIEKAVAGYPVNIIVNDNWQQGIGSSLAIGVKNIIQRKVPKPEGILIYLGDQPRITAQHLNVLYAAFAEGREVVASGYGGTFGPPLICGKQYFTALQGLKGDEGAKRIFKDRLNEVFVAPFEPGRIDIDKPEDLEHLK